MKLRIKNRLSKLVRGFSLIELMVVVAIIGVLASIAVPAYDGYMTRARLSHLVTIADTIRKGVTEFRVFQAAFPADAAALLEASGLTGANDDFVNIRVGMNGMATGADIISVTNVTDTAMTITIPTRTINGNPIMVLTAAWTGATGNNRGGMTWTCQVSWALGAVPTSFEVPNCTSITR